MVILMVDEHLKRHKQILLLVRLSHILIIISAAVFIFDAIF